MILAQLSWSTTFALAWAIFGGWLLGIEHEQLYVEKKKIPGYRYTKKGRRRSSYLWMATGVWLFVICIIITTKG